MNKSTTLFLCLAAAVYAVPSRAASVPSETSWSSAQSFEGLIQQARARMSVEDSAPVAGRLARLSDPLIDGQTFPLLPPPDDATKNWLASRIPGLDTSALRAVPAASANAVMERAANAQSSYLDIFTDPSLGRDKPELYYLSQDVLQNVDQAWISGTLPVTGNTKDGHPFHMQGLVAGGGAIYMLYDTPEFTFRDGRTDFKITDEGRIGISIDGPGAVSLKGLSACGCMGPFCGCAEIQGMTKTGPGKARIKTSRGDKNADLPAVRAR